MKNFILPEDLLMWLKNYLSEKPWTEVNAAMFALQNLRSTESLVKPPEETS